MNQDSLIKAVFMRKKEGNKEQDILDASVRVFSRIGYSNTKMHRIADEAGIATGTIYLYFKNKEDILLKIFETVWQNLFCIIEDIDSKEIDAISKFRKTVDNIFDMFNKNAALAIVFVNEQHHIMKRSNKIFMNYYTKTITICENVLQEGIAGNVIKSDIDPSLFSTFFFGGIRYVLTQWAHDPKKYDFEKASNVIKRIILTGIAI
jgi:TetR/AcrR family transcriptional regulator, fatty acid metabolism regulator protein